MGKHETTTDEYLIWDIPEQVWWQSDGVGYTASVHAAGRYERRAALRWCVAHGSSIPVLRRDAFEIEKIANAE